jgi:hypothetical protein
MPTFEIEQYELHAMRYRVEAADEADAIAKRFQGEAEPVSQSQDFVEVAEDFGLPDDEYPDFAQAVRQRNIPVDDVIPSIRSIGEIRS